MNKNRDLTEKPRFLRAGPARGVEKDAVDRKGGIYGAGIIRKAAIVTRGEALGHGVWLDAEFLQQTAEGINASAKGVKGRFTHPGLSSDGLGSFLGRAMDAEIDGDVVRADIHFSKTAHNTPDGDLAGYVMDRAEEDAETFGTSIVYQPDYGAEDLFEAQHEDEDGRFQSPDPDNGKNYPHARLAELRAADVVDDPAANPSGLFHRQEVAHEADALVAYAVGMGPTPATCRSFDVDPDRIKSFVARFLDAHGLEIKPKKTEAPMAEEKEPTPEEKPAETAPETKPAEEAKPEEEEATPAEPAAEKPAQQSAADPREECKRFVAAFGAEKGGQWYAEGLSFEAAQEQYVEGLKAENEQLRQKLASINRGEAEPANFRTGEKDEKQQGATESHPGLTPAQAAYAASLKKAGDN
jgi:hypothetical protein